MGSLPGFYLKAGVYTVSFLVCYYALNALNFGQFLKPGHVGEARVLYFLIVMALAFLTAQFILGFIYQA